MAAGLVLEQPGSPAHVVELRNAPAAFMAASQDKSSGARDPVLQRLKTLSIPFVYDQSMYVNSGAGELWEEQAMYGYHTGVAMALHLSGGRHFMLGVDRDTPLPTDPDAVIGIMAQFQLLAVFAQETAIRLLTPIAAADERVPELGRREQEVLRWARDGKSTDVIAQLLGISTSTVNYHLRLAMDKLGVNSKFAAAAKADRLGLL